MDKGAKDKLASAPGENGRRQDAQKEFQPTTGRDETEKKTQKKMERASRMRSSSAGSEKMERDSERQKQMEGHCSTGQGPQRAVVPMEEEEEYRQRCVTLYLSRPAAYPAHILNLTTHIVLQMTFDSVKCSTGLLISL